MNAAFNRTPESILYPSVHCLQKAVHLPNFARFLLSIKIRVLFNLLCVWILMNCVLPWNKIKPLAILPFTSTGILSRKGLVNWFSLGPPMRITFLLPAKQNAMVTLQNNEYTVFENRYPV